MRKRLIVLAVTALAVLVLLGLNTARNAAGWQPIVQTPAQRLSLLSGSWRMILPQGPGPHKAAILLSGCDGVHDNMDYWARVMRAQGRAALILDSHAPRKLNRAQAWRAVCAGQILTGAERAGDLAVALAALRDMPGIDARDVAVLGASHGGWAAMELMAQLGQPDPPPGLSDWPLPPRDLAAQVGPVVLLYPYCGLISGAAAGPWPSGARGLMLLAENDSITDPASCREMLASLRAQNTDLHSMTLPDIDHGFDQHERSRLSQLEFNAAARDKATALIVEFLQPFASTPAPGL